MLVLGIVLSVTKFDILVPGGFSISSCFLLLVYPVMARNMERRL